MKQLLITLILFTFVTAFGQTIPKDEETGKFKYEKIIQAENLSQVEIYDRAKSWVVRTLKSGDNVVNLDDKSKAAITATGNILLENQRGFLYRYENVVLNFKFNVYAKEGRFKIIVDNFTIHYDLVFDDTSKARSSSLEDGFSKEGLVKGKKATEKMHAEVELKMKKLISDIEATILTQTMETENDDW